MHDGGDVDVELGLQLSGVGGPKLARGTESGVVDQHLHSGGQPVGDPVAVGGVGEVGAQHFDVDPVSGPQLSGEVVESLRGARHQDEVVAVARIAAGIARTKARGGAGDERDGTGHAATLPAQRW